MHTQTHTHRGLVELLNEEGYSIVVKLFLSLCYYNLIQWDQAIELANQNNVGDVNNLLVKYANHLLEKNQKLTAIALYPLHL